MLPGTTDSMSRSISPPPSKRRRLQDSADAIGTANERSSSSLHPLRIFSWNVNGIAPFLQPTITSFFGPAQEKATRTESDPCPLRDILRRHDFPTVLHLQEVKLHPDDTASRRAVERAISRRADEPATAPSYRAYFCLPRDKHNARGFGRKVYGVCSMIREDFISHYGAEIREVDWDLEGRFLVCETQRRGSVPALAIFNCYMVNGTSAPYKDSNRGHTQGTRHDRKLRVHDLLQNECRRLEAEQTAVVLAGDMNVARERLDGHPNLRTSPLQHCINRADFETKFFRNDTTSLNMVDSFRELFPHKAGYTYYPRHTSFGDSCDRVDLIMLSRSLRPNLTQAGILETSVDRGPSDHVPLYVELDFELSGHTGRPAESAALHLHDAQAL